MWCDTRGIPIWTHAISAIIASFYLPRIQFEVRILRSRANAGTFTSAQLHQLRYHRIRIIRTLQTSVFITRTALYRRHLAPSVQDSARHEPKICKYSDIFAVNSALFVSWHQTAVSTLPLFPFFLRCCFYIPIYVPPHHILSCQA